MTSDTARADSNPGTVNNFLKQRISDDLAAGKVQSVVTRFPPEPNGYLHIGHAKSICINFGLAEQFGGHCHLRFDDTNPEKESQEFIDAITDDVHWLGFEWHGETRYASDYFGQLFEWAQELIRRELAYVCDLSAEQAREYRGSLTQAGKNSPYRERSVEENLALLQKMRDGEFDEGHCVLRAKIDMAAPNINLRDPIIYRIRKVHHHRTGNDWCVYPTYDFTHGQSDAIEGITHSVCTLEFEDHRPLYEWFLANIPVPAQPKQIEFSRLNVNYTVTSKRKLKQLVDGGVVDGWDDPRMPTISGMRRRGYAPQSLRNFCESVGVTRVNGVVDMSQLEFSVREYHNDHAPRAMVVMQPLKVIISNYDAGKTELLRGALHPQNDSMGDRELPFTKELYIDREDFRESANKKFKRLVLGKKVRLRNAYVIFAESVVHDDNGEVVEVHCSYDPATLGEDPPDGVKPKGVIQWVSAEHALPITVREYDRLFRVENPEKLSGDEAAFLDAVNPDSLRVRENCLAEPAIANAQPEQVFQFEREGYFVADRYEHSSAKPVFNKTIGLRDSWANHDSGQDSAPVKGGS